MLLAAACALSSTLSAAQNTVSTTSGTVLPTGTVLLDISNPAATTSLAWNGISIDTAKQYRDIGQRFLATQDVGLQAAVFKIDIVGDAAAEAPILFTIYELTSSSAYPAGTPLYSAIGALPSSMAEDDWLTFSLDAPVQLTKNKTYAIQLSFLELGTDVKLNLFIAPEADYAYGKGFFYQNLTNASPTRTYSNAGGDFQMVLIIPETGSIALLALGGGLLLLLPRFRRHGRAVAGAGAGAVSALALVSLGSLPLHAQDRTTTAEAAAHTILLLGDSTVETQKPTSPLQGWGAMLQEHTAAPWKIVNCASSGKSTKTFKEHSRWHKVLATPARYWFIQFGHNDSHAPGRPESTDAATTYKENLRFYVEEARSRSITPIFVTSMHRLTFNADGTLRDILAPYVAAMKEVGAELSVSLIDLFEPSGKEFLKRGLEESKTLFAPNDPTHFNPAGARWLASLVATQAAALDPVLATAFTTSIATPVATP